MIMRRALALACFLLVSGVAAAEPKPLATEDIRTLLTGNTVHGTWAGREYFSYFEANGWTTYVEPGKPSSLGRWRAHDDRYCSTWGEAGNESCYALEMDGDTLIWLTSDGARYLSSVLPGDQLPK